MILIFFLLILIIILFTLINYIMPKCNKSKKENFSNKILNIYDEPLEKCAEENMFNGSWDSEGKCSELDGGVHQICIKNISQNTKNFSKNTGQSNWSNKRGKNNHCVCLGAWSLFNAKYKNKKSKKVLKCEAIPKISLSDNYVGKFSEGWNKWNGLELDNQIKEGVEGLINNCLDNSKPKKSKKLKKNYCKFAKHVKVLRDSELYHKLC